MSEIIYAPIISNTIPGFINVKRQDGGVDAIIKIPYTDSPAVVGSTSKILLSMKHYKSERLIITDAVFDTEQSKSGYAVFIVDASSLFEGDYYKFQIAYEGGPYSSASIGRYIGKANLSMSSNGCPLINNQVNAIALSDFVATCETIESETIYSYRYLLIYKGKKLADSEEILHIADKDEISANGRIAKLPYKLYYNMEKQEQYHLLFTYTTINGYTDTLIYVLKKNNSAPAFIDAELYVAQNTLQSKENGYVDIKLILPPCPAASLVILRRDIAQNEWETITACTKDNTEEEAMINWKDYTVMHGVTYEYACVQQSEDQLYMSDPIDIKRITPYFDDMYLYDGEKQLRIRFDPKVSSLKETILEQKTDTIGNKYPFFFRNGNVRYKEIPISGLISYWMDEAELFCDVDKANTHNLTHENFASERDFKFKVLEWLNDGKPKLFRSPAEGNCVIRLMNTSLSPNETLGRMLHTFSSTGYEVSDTAMTSLEKLGLKGMPEVKYMISKEQQYEYCQLIYESDIQAYEETGTFIGFSWTTAFPNTNDSITINGEQYFNIGGTLEFPQVIESYALNSSLLQRGDYIGYYIISQDENAIAENTYGTGSNVIMTIGDGSVFGNNVNIWDEEIYEDIKLKDYVEHIYAVVLYKGSKIITASGQEIVAIKDKHYWYNIDDSIESIEGIADIYAHVKEGAISNLLGAFILGKSKLG